MYMYVYIHICIHTDDHTISDRSGAKDGEWGGIQWESVQAFCDASWATTVAQPQDKAYS